MKSIINKLRCSLLAFYTIIFSLQASAQANISDNCEMLGNNINVSVPAASVKSGLDFNLGITLPGQNSCNGTYAVEIKSSSNMVQSTTPPGYAYPFNYNATTHVSTNASILPSTGQGIGINVPFRFKSGATCNGAKGIFDVIIKLTCADGSVKTCKLNVSLTAIAQNYWKVEKKHVWGNLRGGNIIWDVVLTNTNPNPGVGDYNIESCDIYDDFSDGTIQSVTAVNIPMVGLVNGGSQAHWNTGIVASANYGSGNPIVYRVTTTSCKPAGTTVKNCLKIYGPLGIRPTDMATYACATINNTEPICAEVKLVGGASSSAAFSKYLTYGNNLNYAQGCQGEYSIDVSNNGNVPLNNLVISDNFPVGIDVTEITVLATGVNMAYTTTLGTSTTGSGPYNTSVSRTWNVSSPTGFSINTVGSGTLLGGYIRVTIKFTITAATGTVVSNCANLGYSGTYNGSGGSNVVCGVTLPPIPPGSSLQSCVPFTVQPGKAIAGIEKCIRNGRQSFAVGETIPFRIVISNHGQANFTGNLTDLLGGSQALSLVPGSVTVAHGNGYFNPYATTPTCIIAAGLSDPSTSWTPPVLTQLPQNLSGTITNMPGSCELNTAYYLIIEFDALVLPQSYGGYWNTATLGTLSASEPYSIMNTSKIVTTKTVSTEFVEPGQAFSYIINVKNMGSVALKTIRVTDQLPPCVTYTNAAASKLDVSGNPVSTLTPVYSSPNFNFPATLILQPGESVNLVINVVRNANDKGEMCCNQLAKGTGITTDAAAALISDEQGPACVKSALCCNVKQMDVSLSTEIINNKIAPVFLVTAGPLPIQEVEISLMDYHTVYSNTDCKPANTGNLTGHIQPFVGSAYGNFFDFSKIPYAGGSPFLTLQTTVNPVNNVLTWVGGPVNLSSASSWNFNGLVVLNFVAPDILNLDCCKGTVYYCFKVRVKDVNCNVCEKIVCGSSVIPKKAAVNWIDRKAADIHEIQSLENRQPPLQKKETKNFRDLFMGTLPKPKGK